MKNSRNGFEPGFSLVVKYKKVAFYNWKRRKLTIRGGLPILIGVPDLSNPVFVLGDKREPKARFILTKSKRKIPVTNYE